MADHLCPYITTYTYQWIKNNVTITQIEVDSESNTLSFSPLRLSDAGQYTCQSTVFPGVTVVGSHDLKIQGRSTNQDLEV